MMSFAEHRKILADLKRFEAQIPQIVSVMGTIAQNHFIKSFRDQGFTDTWFDPWKRRKIKDSRRGRRSKTFFDDSWWRGGKKVKVINEVRSVKNRAILVKSGALRRSIRKQNVGKYAVDIKSDLPYAKVHNEGLRTGRGNGFKMPKRQFVGYSWTMNSKIEQRIDRIIKRTWRS